jgi:hypothetical protein
MATIDNARVRETDTNGFLPANAHGQNVLNPWTYHSSSIEWNLSPTLHEGCPGFSNIPLFSRLSAEELCQISAHSVARTYPKNTILLHEQDQSGSLYVILSGKVKIYVSDENGQAAHRDRQELCIG